jgi:hypothetical protein
MSQTIYENLEGLVPVDPRDLCRCAEFFKIWKACDNQDRAVVGSWEEELKIVSLRVFDICMVVSIDVVKDDEPSTVSFEREQRPRSSLFLRYVW